MLGRLTLERVRAGLDLSIPGTLSLPTDEKLEASPAPGPSADSGPVDVAPALEDCLSQEVQDSFSFLEDSSSSEPEWVGVEDGGQFPSCCKTQVLMALARSFFFLSKIKLQ